MSHGAEAPNYWPGYVDALTNVVLNLLFLIGVFTIGLVSLNMEVMNAEKKIAELETLSVVAVTQIAAPLPEVRKPVRAKPPGAPASQQLAEAAPAEIAQDRSQRRIVELRFYATLPASAVEAGLPELAVQAREPKVLLVAESPEAYVKRLVSGQLLGKLSFESQQFVWPQATVLPELTQGAPDDSWLLLMLADKENPRLLREAFSRLSSVRTAYLRAGVDGSKLRIQIDAVPPALRRVEGLENTVWIVRRSPVARP